MKSEERLGLIGQNIVRIRKIKNLTSQELGYLCNIDKSQLGKIEKGKINITVKTIEAIAKALDVNAEELFCR